MQQIQRLHQQNRTVIRIRIIRSAQPPHLAPIVVNFSIEIESIRTWILVTILKMLKPLDQMALFQQPFNLIKSFLSL